MRRLLALTGFLATVASIAPAAQQQQPGNVLPPDISLHEAAVRSGGHLSRVGAVAIEGVDPRDIESLAKTSDAVITGTVSGIAPLLFRDGREVETVVDVQVNELYKGFQPSDIAVVVPGGAFTFTDGVVAEVHTPLSGVRMAGAYVFFLKRITGRVPGIETGDRPLCRPATRVDAIIDVSGDAFTPLPLAGTSPFAKRYANMPVASFIAELRVRTAAR